MSENSGDHPRKHINFDGEQICVDPHQDLEASRSSCETILQVATRLNDLVVKVSHDEQKEMDPQGWNIYMYDSRTNSPADVIMVGENARQIEPIADISFNSSIDPNRPELFEGCIVNVGGLRVDVFCRYDENGTRTSQVELKSLDIHGQKTMTGAKIRLLQDRISTPEVDLANPSDKDELIHEFADKTKLIAQILVGVLDDRFHYRVFGRTHQDLTKMHPRYFISPVFGETLE